MRAGVLRDFPGNYDDYLLKIAALEAREPPAASAPAHAPAKVPARAPTGIGKSKEQRRQERERRKTREKLGREIARLESEIQTTESELESLGWKLGDPELYKDVDRMRELSEAKAALEATVAERYAEWERLTDELSALDDLASSE